MLDRGVGNDTPVSGQSLANGTIVELRRRKVSFVGVNRHVLIVEVE